jgi:hypothetical protein
MFARCAAARAGFMTLRVQSLPAVCVSVKESASFARFQIKEKRHSVALFQLSLSQHKWRYLSMNRFRLIDRNTRHVSHDEYFMWRFLHDKRSIHLARPLRAAKKEADNCFKKRVLVLALLFEQLFSFVAALAVPVAIGPSLQLLASRVAVFSPCQCCARRETSQPHLQTFAAFRGVCIR